MPSVDPSVASSFLYPCPPTTFLETSYFTQDRAWLEKVVSEGVRDDFKAMTDIYSRLCTYLDLAATNPPPPLPRPSGPPGPSSGPSSTAGSVSISTGSATDFVPPPAPAPAATPLEAAPGEVPATSGGGGALSTFIAAPPSFSSPPAGSPPAAAAGTAAGGGVEAGRGSTAGELAELEEGVMNDLDVSFSCLLSSLFHLLLQLINVRLASHVARRGGKMIALH